MRNAPRKKKKWKKYFFLIFVITRKIMGILKIWLKIVGVEFDSLQKWSKWFSSISASKVLFFAFKVNNLFFDPFIKHIFGYSTQNTKKAGFSLYRKNVFLPKIYKITGVFEKKFPALRSRAKKMKNAKEFLKINEIVWKLQNRRK